MADLLIYVVVLIAVAFLILWAINQFLPEAAYPARIIVGVVVLIALILLVARMLPTLRLG
jgi:glucose-6-phosphate-specific signal transduction histidine kinase